MSSPQPPDKDQLESWLAQEIADLADIGNVGLYEFPETLLQYEGLSPDEVFSICAAALLRLMATDRYELGWLQWATNNPPERDERDLISIAADSETWSGIGPSGRYLGIARRGK
jgi:hypothetical protein